MQVPHQVTKVPMSQIMSKVYETPDEQDKFGGRQDMSQIESNPKEWQLQW